MRSDFSQRRQRNANGNGNEVAYHTDTYAHAIKRTHSRSPRPAPAFAANLREPALADVMQGLPSVRAQSRIRRAKEFVNLDADAQPLQRAYDSRELVEESEPAPPPIELESSHYATNERVIIDHVEVEDVDDHNLNQY